MQLRDNERSYVSESRESYLQDLDITWGEPSSLSIPLSLPPASGKSLDHSDHLPGFKAQPLLVLLPAERVQTFAERSRHREHNFSRTLRWWSLPRSSKEKQNFLNQERGFFFFFVRIWSTWWSRFVKRRIEVKLAWSWWAGSPPPAVRTPLSALLLQPACQPLRSVWGWRPASSHAERGGANRKYITLTSE